MEELESKRIISLMSGTSCDSIDVGMCEVLPDLSCRLIEGANFSYPEEIRSRIFKLFEGGSVKEVCQMNFIIGEYFAKAALELINRRGKPDFIVSHGQTIFHNPQGAAKSTLQIGESAVIAQRTGCDTISNFREADIAQGGQGAPLVCFADEKWFSKLDRPVAVQNIGGISNVTVVSPDCATFAFDNGLGNIMIDYCTRKFFNKNFDKDGEIAKSGRVCEYWLNCLLQDEYYLQVPPKTTGREYFSTKYIENALKSAPQAPEDIVATVTALTAKTIAQSYERFIYPQTSLTEVILGGGGAYNKALIEMLKSFLPKHLEIRTHEDYGISNNFKEAEAFALLGYCAFYGITNNLPACTGANKRVVMGKITQA